MLKVTFACVFIYVLAVTRVAALSLGDEEDPDLGSVTPDDNSAKHMARSAHHLPMFPLEPDSHVKRRVLAIPPVIPYSSETKRNLDIPPVIPYSSETKRNLDIPPANPVSNETKRNLDTPPVIPPVIPVSVKESNRDDLVSTEDNVDNNRLMTSPPLPPLYPISNEENRRRVFFPRFPLDIKLNQTLYPRAPKAGPHEKPNEIFYPVVPNANRPKKPQNQNKPDPNPNPMDSDPYFLSFFAVNKMLEKNKTLGREMVKGKCTDEDLTVYSYHLKESLTKLVKSSISVWKKALYDVNIPKMWNFQSTYSNDTSISTLQLTDITINGLENLWLSNFEFNVCSMKSKVELKVPQLKMKARYTLDGQIGGYPINGNGDLEMEVDNLKLLDKTNVSCHPLLFLENVCRFNVEDTRTILLADSVKVNVTGVKYRHLTGEQINDGINDFVRIYLEVGRSKMMKHITNQLRKHKSVLMALENPVSLLLKLKLVLRDLPNLDSHSRDFIDAMNFGQKDADVAERLTSTTEPAKGMDKTRPRPVPMQPVAPMEPHQRPGLEEEASTPRPRPVPVRPVAPAKPHQRPGLEEEVSTLRPPRKDEWLPMYPFLEPFNRLVDKPRPSPPEGEENLPQRLPRPSGPIHFISL